MDKENKIELVKVVHRAMDAFIEENKTLYTHKELQSSTAEIIIFVSGFLPRWLEEQL